jgi:acrylyl-CoA reductase (NADPH)
MTIMDTFKALVLEQQDGATHSTIRQLAVGALPEGEVLVRVAYSDLNFKDGLAITGRGKVVRNFPMVPGIDLAGTVEESAAPDYKPGDQVVLTGWGVGEVHWGGHAQLARVKASWLVPLPEGMTLKQAMGIGTAGFTAMQCVMALEEHGLRPGGRAVLVTGATGGVGGIAVAVLAKLGYNVVASTGKVDQHDYLTNLGASEVIGRLAPSSRPLESERWASAVDTVGGPTLAALIPALANNSSVAACGNAGGAELHTTVFPFILRGVNLLGILSVNVPFERRRAVWDRLARDLPAKALDSMIQVAPLEGLPALSQAICDGQVRGRVVVDVNA